ncbi:MAG: glycerol-3-phosphate 1-O-acyltransferase PlsY [Rhodospirillales bacterium]|nr:glycerol-3-phosphate 1-O-acyltransferase PlsY [Rhodospirillales bacterium]
MLDGSWPILGAALVAGYLLGSIPFGLVLTRLAGLGDIRSIGSGNIGATNVLRTGRKGLALATLLLDSGKGAVAVLVARQLFGPEAAVLSGFGALMGHLFPVWLGFKGGKGVATALGTLVAIDWHVGLAACATWLAVALVFRFSSLSSLLAVAAAPVYAWYLPRLLSGDAAASGDPMVVLATGAIAIFVWARHHTNIRRLLAGEEPKIGRSKAA